MTRIKAKPIPWYEWLYLITKCWNVINNKWKWINPHTANWIYQRIELSKNWKRKKYLIHRLVYCTYNKLSLNYDKNVLHKDEWLINWLLNNHLYNLFEWTQRDNVQDCIKKWRRADTKWEKHWNSKYTNTSIKFIKYLIGQWFKDSRISKMLWVLRQTVYNIRNWKSWKHI